ncbi:hypothetical protein FQN60_015680, partial [Etheostoma spectabile]
MPEVQGGGGCSWGKWKLRKGGSRSAIPALFTITEEEDGRRDARRRKKREKHPLNPSNLAIWRQVADRPDEKAQ